MDNAFSRWVWRLWCDYKWLLEEIDLLYEHPTRKATLADISYHWSKLIGELTYPWYCFKRGVRNLKRWFPVIWKTDVFDHGYLFDVIDRQLADMEKFFAGENTHCMGAKRRARQIRWTRRLLELHQEEYYTVKHYTDWEKEHGERKHESKVVKEDEFGVPLLYSWEDNMTEDELAVYRAGMHKARDMDEKVWKLFIKNLSRARGWWD